MNPQHRNVKRWPIVFVAFSIAIILVMAAPVPLWRTGRPEMQPLNLITGGPAILHSGGIWIDTDAACGATPTTDPDDCLAIAWLVENGHRIVGVSTSHGNASGDVVFNTTETLLTHNAAGTHSAIPILRGWAGPIADTKEAVPPSRAALRKALQKEPLTILALGPLTNVADALEGQPELQRKVKRLVAVMGHQPGHLFHPSEALGGGVLMGHGPIFRDLNFSMDEAATRSILQMRLPLTLIPYDASVQAGITAADLEILAQQGPALRWAAETAEGWFDFWKNDIGQPGFFPFDWVAAAYVIKPSLFNCAKTNVWIATEWAFWIYPRESLLVGVTADISENTKTLYCPQTDPSLHDYLIAGPVHPLRSR